MSHMPEIFQYYIVVKHVDPGAMLSGWIIYATVQLYDCGKLT